MHRRKDRITRQKNSLTQKGLALLMVVTILAVTGFQVYWLRQNFFREKRSLSIKAEGTFRETIFRLQASKLNLEGMVLDKGDSSSKLRFFRQDGKAGDVKIRMLAKPEMISTINVYRSRLKDSARLTGKLKPGVIISMKDATALTDDDSISVERSYRTREGRIFKLLSSVDSLQDSLRLPEIDSAYRIALKKDRISVPYTIEQRNNTLGEDEERSGFNEVTVGLVKPVTYKLQLGNTFPYLMRQILQPILFSLFLLGITILSFLLLYRNMLRQRRLSELKNEFISNITHELKTPIATVGVAIEALRNFNAMDNPERTREYLDISQNELQRLGLLVDKVLKLSMFEKKEVELKTEPVNLGALVQEVIASLRLQLEKNHAKVTIHAEEDVTIMGDRLHLLSVVFNLVDNAIKYSKDAPVIEIIITRQSGMAVMAVRDKGIGIAPEYRDRIFEKFFRVPHGDTHNAKGYGLGLSYVAQVIVKHGGTIHVESEPGAGSLFTVQLPLHSSVA